MSSREFARGADLSLLQDLQDHGVAYKEDGQVKDPLRIFQDHGGNWVRLRLFVQPNGRDGQVNTLPYTLRLAKRIKDADLRLLLDLHYSDAWADPSHQTLPAAWHHLSHAQLVSRVFTYTRDTIAAFRAAGCPPDMVQVGNEITNGMLWPDAGPLSDPALWNESLNPGLSAPTKWDALADVLKAGIRGVHEGDRSGHARVMIHIDKGGSRDVSRRFYEAVQQRGVAFDVIGLSYYPFWHGTLADLRANMALLARTFHKDIIVVETGYDTGGGPQDSLPFPPTPDGQRAFLEELIRTVAATPDGRGRGIFYWAPEWIAGPSGTQSAPGIWEHRALFDPDGAMRPAMRAFEVGK